MPYVRTPRGLKWVSSSQAGRPVSPYGSRYPRRPVRRPGSDGYYTPPPTEAAGGDGMVTVEGWVPGPGGGLVRGPVTYSGGGGPTDKKKPLPSRNRGTQAPEPSFPSYLDTLGLTRDQQGSSLAGAMPSYLDTLGVPRAGQGPQLSSYVPSYLEAIGVDDPSRPDYQRLRPQPNFTPGPDVFLERGYGYNTRARNGEFPQMMPGPDVFLDPGYGYLYNPQGSGGSGGGGSGAGGAPAPGAEEPWFPYYMRGGGGVNLNFGGGGSPRMPESGPWGRDMLNWRF